MCYQGGHLAQVVIGAFLTAAFVALVGLFTLVFYDNNCMSANIIAKAHGEYIATAARAPAQCAQQARLTLGSAPAP